MKKKTYYITTPIYYVNALPHIGHAYATIAADALAIYQRMLGKDVVFLTGTDENSLKNVRAAEASGDKDTKSYLDRMSREWKKTWDDMGITHTDFIRTTSDEHKSAVLAFYKRVQEKGDIYKGTYQGLFCEGCEEFLSESELEGGLCREHRTKPKFIEEHNYFFKLTRYRKELLEHIRKNPEFIFPKTRRNEVIRYIEEFMTDVSISRESVSWGIPVPNDTKQVIYVWFDALISYLSGVGFANDEKRFKKFWPCDLHLIGKGILKFHAALWPAMLMSAGLPLPKSVFVHGYYTVDGKKISKSLGNAIDPNDAIKRFGNDALRYYLLREVSFGNDGDFSFTRLEEVYRSELAHGIGNLFLRVLSMVEKYAGGKIPKAKKMVNNFPAPKIIGEHMESLSFEKALKEIEKVVASVNSEINKKAPWKLAGDGKKSDADQILFDSVEALRNIALALTPFMPNSSSAMLKGLGLDPDKEKKAFTKINGKNTIKAGTRISKAGSLFPVEK